MTSKHTPWPWACPHGSRVYGADLSGANLSGAEGIHGTLDSVRDALPSQREWDQLEADRLRQDRHKDART